MMMNAAEYRFTEQKEQKDADHHNLGTKLKGIEEIINNPEVEEQRRGSEPTAKLGPHIT